MSSIREREEKGIAEMQMLMLQRIPGLKLFSRREDENRQRMHSAKRSSKPGCIMLLIIIVLLLGIDVRFKKALFGLEYIVLLQIQQKVL